MSGVGKAGRNTAVENAVTAALERIDAFIAGEEIKPLSPVLRAACDLMVATLLLRGVIVEAT